MAYRQGSFLSLLNLTLKSPSRTISSTVWAAPESLPRGSVSPEIWWIRATEMGWLAQKSSAIKSSPKISCLVFIKAPVWSRHWAEIPPKKCFLPSGGLPLRKTRQWWCKDGNARGHRDGATVGWAQPEGIPPNHPAKAYLEGIWGELTQSGKVQAEWKQVCSQIPKPGIQGTSPGLKEKLYKWNVILLQDMSCLKTWKHL